MAAMGYDIATPDATTAYVIWREGGPIPDLNEARRSVRAYLKTPRARLNKCRSIVRRESANSIRKRGENPPAGL